MKSFFFACTQHHIFLSLALIKQNSLKDAHIIFYVSIEKFNNPIFFEKIQTLQKEMGFSITYLPVVMERTYRYVLLKPLKRILVQKRHYKNADQFIRPWKSEKKCFYFFNDDTPVCQYIISKYSKDKENSFILVQDGIAQYIDSKVRGTCCSSHWI